MTQQKDLLRPLEPAQRLASADRETLETIHAAVGECTSLIVARSATMEQATDRQLAMQQTCVDAIGHLAERIDAAGKDEAARHAELTAAVRQVSGAVAGLARRLDASGAEHAAGVRGELAALRGTLERIAGTHESHDRRLRAVTDAVSILSAAVAGLREEAYGVRAERTQAQASQTRTLGDVVKGTASLGARFGRVEQVLRRYRSDFWLHAVALPLLIGCAFFFGMMADFMAGWFAEPAVTAMLPWPPEDAALEVVIVE